MRAVTVRVPAKVNLALGVGPARADGFHQLATVYQAVDLEDTVTATIRDDAVLGISVLAPDGSPGPSTVPADSSNLAVRAAASLRARLGDPRLGADLRIVKRIPVAGGMAGGSADAAAALVACHELWGGALPLSDLLDLAAGLGSDVPFLLVGGTAIGSGHGEEISPVADAGSHHWIFATSDEGLSTPAVYREFDRLTPAPDEPVVPGELLAALAAGDSARVGAALGNDLMPAALSLRPDLAATVERARALGAAGALVSGSGPTVAVLAPDAEAADALAAGLAELVGAGRLHRARGPAEGARIAR